MRCEFLLSLAVCFCLSAENVKGGETVGVSEVKPNHGPVKAGGKHELVDKFMLGDAKVKVYQTSNKQSGLKTRSLNLKQRANSISRVNLSAKKVKRSDGHHVELGNPHFTTLDLTAADTLNPICFPGLFQMPKLEDCSTILDTELRSVEGVFETSPGTTVVVSKGNCALTFQNPCNNNYNLKFDVAQLGKIGGTISRACFDSSEESIGGATKILDYLEYKFYKDVVISLQRFDQDDS
ncbi:hypothetical protein BY996DRAFT_2710067 [Phakopsora pachyrhizi]|uniref:Expressed protein n=1 Tax=Phakopsora pachyrhizi TaxID=170000 RepID=A0AAV0B0T7_PHAPC|nr:hypothetical protein BY996DRAFT_2710067 [Phakopsora pachyrhizi]CAH7676654.1 expressed protein [Phakopsora pachyrhizi]